MTAKLRTPKGMDALWKSAILGWLLVLLSLLLLTWWQFHVPSPGKAVAALAVAAAVISFRPDASGLERSAWVLVLSAFFFIELRAINHEHSENVRQQQEAKKQEDDRFAGILQQNQSEFDATMKRLEGLAGLSEESINQITGAGTFCYFSAVPNMGTGDPISFPLTVWVSGRYPMRQVTSVIQKAGQISINENLVQPTLPLSETLLPGVHPLNYRVGLGEYSFQTWSAALGPINEKMKLKLVDGRLDQNIEVWGGGKRLYKLGHDDLGFATPKGSSSQPRPQK